MKAAPFPQLQAFLAVARLRSFSGAARELGVSRSAVSQAVRQLEEQLHVVLLVRTTRSVSLTDAGRKLVESAGPALGQVVGALAEVSARPGEAVGRLRLSVPRTAVPFVIEPVLPTFRDRHPRVEVEIVIEERLVDIVGEGYDAGVRLSEAIERDMVQVRLTDAFRFVVVGSPKYLERRGTPQRPEDLLRHECLTFRSATTGALYAWELERGRRSWRLPVRGSVVTNDHAVAVALAAEGLGLAYAFEPAVMGELRRTRLVRVLEAYAPTVPGYFLYFPSRAQSSFQRHAADDPAQAAPGRDFLERCPVAARMAAVLKAVAEAPPNAFAGGGYWEAMHRTMAGYYEVRVDGRDRRHYRLFCVLERDGARIGLGGPGLVVITGMAKPFRTIFTERDYARVRQLGDEYRSRVPRSVPR